MLANLKAYLANYGHKEAFEYSMAAAGFGYESLRNLSPPEVIGGVFPWEDSPEGEDYWIDANHEFSTLAEYEGVNTVDFKIKIWLASKGLWANYVKYWSAHHEEDPENIDEFLEGLHPGAVFSFAFDWDDTEEGHAFWEEVYLEWGALGG